jgi:phosphoglycolate phosphatase
MTTTVLFDLDGVLVDSRAAITTSLNHALAEHGQPTRPPAELYHLIGPALADAFAELAGLPRDSDLVVACVASYRAHYRTESLRSTTLVPGMPDVLEQIATTRRVAVATSKPAAFAEPILATLGLRHLFVTVAGPDLNPFGETKAATIAKALEVAGRPAVMVGDRRHDIAGAHANGLPAIGVTWGIGDANELRAAGADLLVDDPWELPGAAALLLAN